eukprot:m.156215 g.156215  ORF g.156215 m.156215 type:complete len:123 (-) comp30979_c0_seq4:190-558(-)
MGFDFCFVLVSLLSFGYSSASGLDAIEKARRLSPPVATGQYNAEFENADFWEENAELLAHAWDEYGLLNDTLGSFSTGFLQSKIVLAVEHARKQKSLKVRTTCCANVFVQVWYGLLCLVAVL